MVAESKKWEWMEDGELVLSRCNGVAMCKLRTSYCIGMKE